MRPRRPDSITIIGWLFIIGGVLNLVMTMVRLDHPGPSEFRMKELCKSLGAVPPSDEVLYIALWLNLFISAGFGICGLMFLSGRRGARRIYIYVLVTNLAIGIATAGWASLVLSLPSIVYHSIVLVFLFRAGANKFFTGIVPTQAFQTIRADSTNDAGEEIDAEALAPPVDLRNIKIE